MRCEIHNENSEIYSSNYCKVHYRLDFSSITSRIYIVNDNVESMKFKLITDFIMHLCSDVIFLGIMNKIQIKSKVLLYLLL